MFFYKSMNKLKNKIIYSVTKFTAKVILNLFYRIRFENVSIPDGRVVVVSNHVSFLDSIMLVANCKRKMRFVIYEPIYRNRVLNPFFKAAGCIPITSGYENKEILKKAYDSIAEALENGEAVVIYPEGKLTSTGHMNEFKKGIEKIIKRTPSDVYPTAIDGLYGSYFSRCKKRKLFGKLFSKIRFIGGDIVSADNVTSYHLECIVKRLLGE